MQLTINGKVVNVIQKCDETENQAIYIAEYDGKYGILQADNYDEEYTYFIVAPMYDKIVNIATQIFITYQGCNQGFIIIKQAPVEYKIQYKSECRFDYVWRDGNGLMLKTCDGVQYYGEYYSKMADKFCNYLTPKYDYLQHFDGYLYAYKNDQLTIYDTSTFMKLKQ